MTVVRGTVYLAGGGTGGHLYPGLAIAHALRRQAPELQLFFFGAERGIEARVLPTAGFPYELLDLHPLYRSAPWQNWKTLRGMRRSMTRIAAQFRREPPLGVVGTGGYAASALLASALQRRVPYFLQEQNAHVGLTVRLFSRWARHTFLGFDAALGSLPEGARGQALVTGNPITPPPTPRPDRAAARAALGFPPAVSRVILVFGGSQGARAINEAVAASVLCTQPLPPDVGLYWITGPRELERYAHHAGAQRRIVGYQSPMADAYAAADVAVARAGAMGTAELEAWGIPMVVVPLPTAAANHQLVNARALVAAGRAVLLEQAALTGAALSAALAPVLGGARLLPPRPAQAGEASRAEAADVIARHILVALRLLPVTSP